MVSGTGSDAVSVPVSIIETWRFPALDFDFLAERSNYGVADLYDHALVRFRLSGRPFVFDERQGLLDATGCLRLAASQGNPA
jgi:hypothetical protein